MLKILINDRNWTSKMELLILVSEKVMSVFTETLSNGYWAKFKVSNYFSLFILGYQPIFVYNKQM